MLTRSTTAISRAGRTRRTLPLAPRSRPEMTTTWSFFLIFDFLAVFMTTTSDHFRCQRDDLHELLLAQLARHRPEDAGADRLPLIVDDHRRVGVEADVAAVAALRRVHRPDDDRLDHGTLLHRAVGSGLLHRGRDDVAEMSVLPESALEMNAGDLLGAGVV